MQAIGFAAVAVVLGGSAACAQLAMTAELASTATRTLEGLSLEAAGAGFPLDLLVHALTGHGEWTTIPLLTIPLALIGLTDRRLRLHAAFFALAGLASLPREPYEAAHLDGATPLQSFWHITLPLLRPTLVVAILFRSIDALKTFDIIFVMTQGGPANSSETINILLFNQAFSYFNMGYAASMAVALFALVMGASLILIKVRRSASW